MPGAHLRDPTRWLVRRAGLARVTTFTAATGVALAAVAGARPLIALPGLVVALLAALVGLTASRRHGAVTGRPSSLLVVWVVLIGFFGGYLGGSLRATALLDSRLEALIGSTVSTELVVTGPVRANGGWQSATAEIRGAGASLGRTGDRSVPAAAIGESVLLEIAPPEDAAGITLAQGLIVTCRGTIEAPEGPSASGFDQAAYLRNQGIRVVLRVQSEAITALGRRGGVAGWFDRLRGSARAHLSQGPDPRLDELLQGVVMGDTVGIDEGWVEAFRRSGTAHMLSVSGLHVASLAAIMIGLARLIRASRAVGFILAAGAALLMIPFVGASPPLIRSAVMIVIVLAGSWAGRRRDQWQVLALAALVVLALNPFAVFDVGFQLSFAAFAGMLGLVAPFQRLMTRLPKAIGSNLAVSAAASLGTAPVSLLVFGRTSLVAPLANVLVVPFLPAITGLGMASVFLGFMWSGISRMLDALASLPLAWTVEVSRFTAAAPVLSIRHVAPSLLALLAAAAVTPAGLAMVGRAVGTPFGLQVPLFSRTTRWLGARRPRSRRRGAALGVAIVLAGLALGFVVYSPLARGFETAATLAPGRGWPDQVEVRVLDVGQGNSILVRTPEHRAFLFDGGPAGCALGKQLHTLGVRKLDLVVVSHPHADHFAGLLEAIDGVEVETLVDQTTIMQPTAVQSAVHATGGSAEARDYLKLLRTVVAHGGRHILAPVNSSIEAGDVTLRFFPPVRPVTLVDGPDPWAARAGPPTGDELNGSSLATVLSAGSVDVLLPGDAEAEVLESRHLPPVDVLVVPHHGSGESVSAKLLEELGVDMACISVGKGNSFGHPAPSTLSLLRELAGPVFRTDEAGWVSFTLGGDRVALGTERRPGY